MNTLLPDSHPIISMIPGGRWIIQMMVSAPGVYESYSTAFAARDLSNAARQSLHDAAMGTAGSDGVIRYNEVQAVVSARAAGASAAGRN